MIVPLRKSLHLFPSVRETFLLCSGRSSKHNRRRSRLLIPAARWLGGDGRNVFDGDLTAARLRAFDFDLVRVARLLADLLMRRGLVADVENFRRFGCEEKNARFFRDARVSLVQNRTAEREAFEVTRVAVGVGAGEHAFALRQAAEKQFRPDE